MKTFFPVYGVLLFCLLGLKAFSQESKPLQLSGVVLTTDSLSMFIPYAYVRIPSRNTGIVCNEEGFFSLPALPGDSLVFSHLGFKNQTLYIPDSLKAKSYLIQVFLKRDTTVLAEVSLYPWPTPERFKSYFMSMQVKTTEMDLAMRNLAIQSLRDRAASMGYDSQEIQTAMIKLQEQQLYNAGRYYGADGQTAILGAFTNPFAWAQFFESLKSKKKR